MDIVRYIEAMEKGSAAERLEAVERLARAGEAAQPAVIPLVQLTSDADEQIREWATAALEELGPPPQNSVSQLAGLLHGLPSTAFWAATLLGRLPSAPQSITMELVWALEEHPEPQVRQRAAWALGKLHAEESLAALQRAAAGDDPRLSRLADQAQREIVSARATRGRLSE